MADEATILVVDDEPEVREMLEEYLRKRGFTVLTAEGGVAMWPVMAAHHVDLVLLDRRMPGSDGFMLAREVRAQFSTGIILLTAAGEISDRLAGLAIGVDDYLVKPFDPRELLARIKSVLRRMAEAPAKHVASAVPQQTCWRVGHLLFYPEARMLATPQGDDVPLTSMEFDLLNAFLKHPREVLSREQLLEMAHQRGWEHFDRSIDLRILRLRRKIEEDPTHPQFLKTVRGAGYMFVPGNEA